MSGGNGGFDGGFDARDRSQHGFEAERAREGSRAWATKNRCRGGAA